MSRTTGASSAGGGQGGARQAAGAAQEKAQQVAGQAQQQAEQAMGQGRDRVREQVDQRSTQAGERVRGTAQDVRSVADELRNQGKDQPARLADQAADRAERVGSYLQQSDADRILSDVEDFGRRQPLAVMAGGLILGFAASRFLKASSAKRYERGGDGYERRAYDTPSPYRYSGSDLPSSTVDPLDPIDPVAPAGTGTPLDTAPPFDVPEDRPGGGRAGTAGI